MYGYGKPDCMNTGRSGHSALSDPRLRGHVWITG
jgi:hypothetical protein